MKLYRYLVDGVPTWGQAEGMQVRRCAGDPWRGLRPTDVLETPGQLLAPATPPMIVGIGLNYRQHANETNAPIPQFPVVFFKALGALAGPSDPIRLPRKLVSSKVDYEAELAIVLSRDCRNATREDALSYVLGYTAANDVSARDWQKEWGGSQWSRAKSFDTFCPLGPALVTADEIPNPNQLTLACRVNGETLQSSNTSDMIFDVPSLLEFLSGDTTLPAGTVILTGTPQGVGMARTPPRWLTAGDRVEIEVEGIGILANPVE